MRIVVTGATGLLGRELLSLFVASGHDVIGLGHAELDLEEADSVSRLTGLQPEVLINCAAWTDVDGCARDPDRAMRINGRGAGLVAQAADRAGALTVQVSTNEVFDGQEHRAYTEADEPNPINPYGASKLAGEWAVAAAGRHLIVRTAWIFGVGRGFPSRIIAAAQRADERGEPLGVVDDEWGNPTPASALAKAIASAVHLREDASHPTILHLAGEPPVTRYGWAMKLIEGLPKPPRIEPIPLASYQRPSRVPPHAVLDTSRSRAAGIEPLDWRRNLAQGAMTETRPGR